MDKLIKFRDLLQSPEEFNWADSLFLPDDKIWLLDSICAVINMDDLEDDTEDEDIIPEFARKNKLMYALNIQDVQDIVSNARNQVPKCSLEDLLRAFMYYYTHDAFVDF